MEEVLEELRSQTEVDPGELESPEAEAERQRQLRWAWRNGRGFGDGLARRPVMCSDPTELSILAVPRAESQG